MTEKTEAPKELVVQKALPFKYDAGWTGVPNTIFETYSFHPKFTGSTMLVYLYLLLRHNHNEGYAWPTHDQIADAICISRTTVGSAIRALKELDLIIVERNPTHGNDVYFFKRPIDDRSTFERKFPEALEKRIKHEQSRLLDIQQRHERKEEFEAKRRAAKQGLL
ncbi:helix-turn-helix domain-containing protein [Lysinibacillus fusiformis]|uniref:helix-turn-helix domain-containing protein n=1 Tax=Lysinibacillus fusiformis TaxID=28031 RepID=UPI001967AB72|nr:helix-turn-helix domain-containing protein [Lysinibacillus fusiformis]QSB09310.1 helix-turn-helix domain-containing protein [Lysinibacillus fusiformis]UXJ70917.1 helix-turn-helix domain-containing protein [Lysinibacillus fusiformis]